MYAQPQVLRDRATKPVRHLTACEPTARPLRFRARGCEAPKYRKMPTLVEGSAFPEFHLNGEFSTVPNAGGEGGSRMGTSKSDASKASKILSNPKSTPAQKSVAASDLAQKKSGK